MRVYARMYVRAYDSRQIVIRTHDQHTTGTRSPEKRITGKEEKPVYICIFAHNEKKYKKSLKKFGNVKKPPYLCIRNQTTNKFNNKITKQ